MRKLREPRLAALVAVSGAVLALGVACSSSDDNSSGGAGTGGTGAAGGSSTAGKGGTASGGSSGHAGTGGSAHGGSGTAGAATGGGGAANGGEANGGGGATNGGTAGAGTAGGGAGGSSGHAGSGGSGGSSGHAGSGGSGGSSGHAGSGGSGGSTGGGGAGGAAAGAGGASGGAAGTGGSAGGAAGSGGSGGFTPVAITLSNPGFETGNGDLAHRGDVQGWAVSAATGEVLTDVGAYIHYPGNQTDPHSGWGFLAFWTDGTSGSDYKDTVQQQVTSLTNGTYEVSAWIEGASSGENAFYIFAKDYSSTPSDQMTQNVTPTGGWVHYKLSNIPVTSGKLTLGFYADCVKGTWINIDDVTLFRTQ